MASSSAEKGKDAGGPQVQGRTFPPVFNLYATGLFASTSKRFFLAEHQTSKPLYAVTTHTGWSGLPSLVLHSGPRPEDAPLSSFNKAGLLSGPANFTLPPPGPPIEKLRSSLFSRNFEIEVGSGSNGGDDGGGGASMVRESFEWRTNHGLAPGRRLMRVATGEEVASYSSTVWSGNKVVTFSFAGAGADGSLGERWAVAAVITGLGQWNSHRSAKHHHHS